MKIVGIDYSMNSPGIIRFELDKDFEITKTDYLGFTQVKKNAHPPELIHFKKKDFPNNIAQYIWINSKILAFIFSGEYYPDYIAIEGYAMGAKGRVFDIAEATGDIKRSIYENGIPMRIHDPNSVKMFATTKGNADKDKMKEYYDGDVPVENLNEDLIDAYHVARLLQLELKLRKGILHTRELPEHQVKVVNRCTKAYPENILVRDFLGGYSKLSGGSDAEKFID